MIHSNCGSRYNCSEVTCKIAKSRTVDLENKDQGYLRLAEIRWPDRNVCCQFANAYQNDVSKSCQFEVTDQAIGMRRNSDKKK